MKKKIKTIPEVIPKRTFSICDPIFRQQIYVLINQDEKSYCKFLTRIGVKKIEKEYLECSRFQGFSTYVENEDGVRDYIIFLKEFNWTIRHQGTLIHEITHTVIKIFESNNIPFNHDTQEFIAHSITGIYEALCRKLLVIVKT